MHVCVFLLGALQLTATSRGAADVNQVIIAVHGGLALPRHELTQEREREIRSALKQSLSAGYKELSAKNGTSLRAVVAAIKILEDSPEFNAGKGAVFTSAKTIELDAAVMEGKDCRAGCVGAVQHIRNPIEAALAVMERSRYVLLVGPAADAFAKEKGLEIVDPEYFSTEYRLKQFEKLKASRSTFDKKDAPDRQKGNRGTVGAVALDHAGNLAAGTSTGGLAFKMPGRIGDSAIIGAGTYADNRACAVSATGDGEYFIRSCAAHDVFARMFYKSASATEASSQVIDGIRQKKAEGGLIVLDHQGQLAMPYAAEGMYRGYVNRNGEMQIDLYGGR
jgi:beta-aspartyl-peptidase (threonine type)